MVGVIVVVIMILVDIFIMSGCCLYFFNVGGFEKIKDMIYNLSNVCVICFFLFVFIDKCFKLFLVG